MAFSKFVAFLAMLLAMLTMAAKGDNIPPILAPYLDGICNQVNCGRGSCEAGANHLFGFTCQCESGWKRTRLDDEQDLQFLPCVIPNCTLDYSCMPAAPPTPSTPHNISVFDPCYWMYCGDGRCTRNHTYTHTCECNSGNYNILNISAFPCYRECALGSDCARLGIRVSNSSSSPDGSNQGSSFVAGKFHWIMMSVVAMAVLN